MSRRNRERRAVGAVAGIVQTEIEISRDADSASAGARTAVRDGNVAGGTVVARHTIGREVRIQISYDGREAAVGFGYCRAGGKGVGQGSLHSDINLLRDGLGLCRSEGGRARAATACTEHTEHQA